MTARLPMNATSLPNPSALPDAWVRRIFSKFEARYGSLFLDRWRGCDMDNVVATWAEELAGFANEPESIAYALKVLASSQFPPTLPEFREACKRAPVKEHLALPHKLTEEDHRRAAEAAKAAKRSVEMADQNKVEAWATHPRSHTHLKFIFEAAERDGRFRQHIATMVEQGVCTTDGKLLKRYCGMSNWEAA